MKAKKVRRLSMDLTKDRGGHVKILSPSIVIRSNDPDFVSDGTYVTLTWPQFDRSPIPYPDEIKWGFPDTPYVPVGQ